MQGVGGRRQGGGIGAGPPMKNGGNFFYSYPEGRRAPYLLVLNIQLNNLGDLHNFTMTISRSENLCDGLGSANTNMIPSAAQAWK